MGGGAPPFLPDSEPAASWILSTVKWNVFATYLLSQILKNCKKKARRRKDYLTLLLKDNPWNGHSNVLD